MNQLARLARFALVAPLGILGALSLVGDAAAMDVEPMSLADAPPAKLSHQVNAPAPTFKVVAKVHRPSAVPQMQQVTTQCYIEANARLRCDQLGTLDLEPAPAEPGRKVYSADFSAMKPAQAGATIKAIAVLEDDKPTVNAVRAEWSWFWGWYCVLEQSDMSTCTSFCQSSGIGTDRMCMFAMARGNTCEAHCQCICGTDSIIVDTAPIPF